MPRTIRDELKRKTARVINHLATALIMIGEIYEVFREHHPNYADYLGVMIQQVEKIRLAMLSFAQTAWDLDEESIMKYLS